MKRYEIILAPQAIQDMKQLSAHERPQAKDAIETHLRHEPGKVSQSRIKQLRNLKQPQYRLRVDELRVFYDIVEATLEILAVVSKAEADAWLTAKGETE